MEVWVGGVDSAGGWESRAEMEGRGHTPGSAAETDCLVYFPGQANELAKLAPGAKRVVVRSHAYAYGSNPKNPGLLTEDRVSLLPPSDPAQEWLRAEEAAATSPNWAAVRLTSVADPWENDLITTRLASSSGT